MTSSHKSHSKINTPIIDLTIDDDDDFDPKYERLEKIKIRIISSNEPKIWPLMVNLNVKYAWKV